MDILVSMYYCKVCIPAPASSPSGRRSPSFCSMKPLGVFLLSLDGMLVDHWVTPSTKFVSTHLRTWVERGTVRVKCLAEEHNTKSWPGFKPGLLDLETSTSNNHEATVNSSLYLHKIWNRDLMDRSRIHTKSNISGGSLLSVCLWWLSCSVVIFLCK